MSAGTKRESSPAFRVTHGKRPGYHTAAVDTFLAAARESFEKNTTAVVAKDVREASFPLVKGGYVIREVDAALARIEDALAARARELAVKRDGVDAWVQQTRREAQVILDHVTRPAHARFARTGWLSFGYRLDEVDLVTDRIADYLRDGQTLTVEQVRSAAFRMQRGGYREEQVDALLDATIDTILAIR